MLLVQQSNHGDMEQYIGQLTVEMLENAKLNSPTDSKRLQPIDDKVVDGIANFVEKCVSNGDPWFCGCIVIALYYGQSEQRPTFHPFEHSEEIRETPMYGTLELSGSEVWVLVDGRYRLCGMFRALGKMTWKRERLAQNPVPVIFLPISDVEQLQELIIRMRKSARSVTRGETIRTGIENLYSVYANWLKGDDEPTHPGAIPEELVNWKSNTITNRLRQFTTLSTLYDSAKILDQAFGELVSPTPEQIDERYRQIHGIWNLLLEEFTLYREALSGHPEKLPFLRQKYLCMRPTGQLIMINLMALTIREHVALNKVVRRLEAVPWQMTDPIWKDVIIVEGRVNGRAAATLLTAKLVAYLVGIPLSDNEIQELKGGHKKSNKALPGPLFKLLGRVDDQEITK